MSIRSLLYSFQEIYPFPAQTTFFSHNSAIVAQVQDVVQPINLVGLPDIADFGITDPVVIVSVVSDDSFCVVSGINNFDWGAGTADLWVSYANTANININLFVCQKRLVYVLPP